MAQIILFLMRDILALASFVFKIQRIFGVMASLWGFLSWMLFLPWITFLTRKGSLLGQAIHWIL